MSATDGRVVIYDATLRAFDTIYLDTAAVRSSTVNLWFGGDGTHLVATLVFNSGSILVQVSRSGGAAVRRVPLDAEHTADVIPLRDGTTFLTIGTAAGASQDTGGVASIVTFSVARTARKRLDICRARPVGAAVRADGDEAFVVCDDDTVTEVDVHLRRVVRQVPIGGVGRAGGGCGARGTALTPSESVLLIPCARSGRLLYLDRATLATVDSVDVAPGVMRVVVSRPLGIAVVGRGTAELALVDLTTHQLRSRIPLPGQPTALALAADGRTAYLAVVQGPASWIVEIDLASGTVAAQTPAPMSPTAIAVWPGEEPRVMTWLVSPRPGEDVHPN